MRLLKQETDQYIIATIDFMDKVDENFRKEIFSHARYTHHQKELEQEKSQHLQIVKNGGKV